jgi:signal transduction histidine kinase
MLEGLFVGAVTPDHRIVYEGFNPAQERARDLAFEAVVGTKPAECLPPDVAEALTRRYRACLAKGVPTIHDEVLDLPAGRRHWQTSLVPVRDSATNRIVALVGIRRDLTDIARTQQDVREIATRLLSLQDEERRRIASELHDTTGQHMIAVGLALTLIEDAVGDRPGLRNAVARMRLPLAEAQKEVRTLSYLLYPPQLRSTSFEASVRGFVSGFCERTGLQARIRISGKVEALPLEIQGAILRVLKEALVNIHRRAEARCIFVILKCGAKALRLLVSDDGKGMSEAAGGHMVFGAGITGMEARIRHFGGVMTMTSSPRGTIIRVRVPVESNQEMERGTGIS